MAEENLNLWQKMSRLRKRVEVMQKDAKGYGYTFLTSQSILARITGLMEKYEISLVPKIIPGTLKVDQVSLTRKKFTKDGTLYDDLTNEYVVQAEMEFAWINNLDPEERIVIPWIFVGSQSDPSQAFGSGLTYASRYFLLRFFNISSDSDDPDNWRSKQREAEAEEERMVTEKIVEEVDRTVRTYLEANPEGGPAVRKIAEKYRKDGNYFKIKESMVAAKLLEEIKKELFKEEK